MLAERISYVALVSSDPAAASQVFERHFGLQREVLKSQQGEIDVFPIGQAALAVFPQGHSLVEGETKTGVHHIALTGSPGKDRQAGLAGRAIQRLARERAAGVRLVISEPLDLKPSARGSVQRIDHIGVASTDVAEDERIFAGEFGFNVESRQTDMEVSMAVETFTSDKYGVVYHARPPEPVGGLRVAFITVGDCELEFLANFDPRQGGEVDHGRSGTTRQDQGAIARFVASRGRGLHHVAVKVGDINAVLRQMAEAGLPMIDRRGRPGSRRALIGFPHPKALGGVLMHLVQRPD